MNHSIFSSVIDSPRYSHSGSYIQWYMAIQFGVAEQQTKITCTVLTTFFLTLLIFFTSSLNCSFAADPQCHSDPHKVPSKERSQQFPLMFRLIRIGFLSLLFYSSPPFPPLSSILGLLFFMGCEHSF